MKPQSADVHVLAIHPDMGDEDDAPDEAAEGEDSGDYEKNLDDAYEAVKDDDKEGFVKALKAAIKACMSEESEY